MNKNISRLVNIAQKETRLIIGLMSGTSLDGLDIALCEISGSGFYTKLSVQKFITIKYDEEFKKEIREIFSRVNISLQKLCLLNEWIGLKHASLVNECLQKWDIKNNSIDLIASHGQTIYHSPKSHHQQEKFGNATLQIGDGDHIAVTTGIITISDFRQKNIAAGAEGAPLVVYGDQLLFSKKGEDRILLNIGGIANFTYLPGSLISEEILCTDVGPGNTLMDAYMQQQFPGKHYDEGSAIAKKGTVHTGLLKTLKDNPFFSLDFPRTTGPELFDLQYLQKAIEKSGAAALSVEDTMRTLNKFSADIIVEAILKVVEKKASVQLYCSGGGIHNPLLIGQIKDQLPNCTLHTTESLGMNPDAKEAVLFAVLANECICGDPGVFGNGTNKIPAVSMGKISFPG